MPSGTSLSDFGDLLLEIPVGRSTRHGGDRTHAAIALVGPPLVEEDLAGRLVGAGEQRADHGDRGAGGDRLGQIAGKLDAAVGDRRHVRRRAGFDAFHDRRQLGHADACHHPRRADRARPDADFHGVGPGVDQGFRAVGRRDIAGDQLGGVAQPPDPLDRRQDAFGMAVRGIDDENVHASVEQGFGAFQPGLADAGRRGDPQPAPLVLAGIRMAFGLVDVLDRDEAGTDAVLVHHKQLLDPVLVQQALGLGAVDRFGHGHQVLAGHQLAHRLLRIVGEPDVPVGDDARQPAVAAFDHRNAGNAVTLHQVQHIGEGPVRRDRDRIYHHARFILLDLADLAGLVRRLHILVQNADTAGLGHGDGELVFGDRIHRRRDQRNPQPDGPGEPRSRIGVGRQDCGPARLQQHVVESQGFGDGCGKRNVGGGHAVRACALQICGERLADADCPTRLTTFERRGKAARYSASS